VFLLNARLTLLITAALLAPSVIAATVHRSTTTAQTASSHKVAQNKRKPTSRRVRGQQAIEPERVTQIQQALIREHYLSGDADGKWDGDTVAAMQKYQADHGWQTKVMPDSRALKNLGLGPDYSGAINAQGSSFTAPPSPSTIPADQVAGFAAASRVSQ
jgi:peptidoglycan hydrolase-like protein with peptidoglycan-binding domain